MPQSPAGDSPSAAPPELTRYTGYLLRRAYVLAAGHARACLRDDVHVREVAVLAICAERGPLSQRELSDVTGLNRTIMVKLVDDLESRNWVVRKRNPADRRSYALRVTATGHRALQGFRAELGLGDDRLTSALSGEEREVLNRHLRALLVSDAGALTVGSMADSTGFLVATAHRQLRGWAVETLAPLGLDPRDFGVLSTLQERQPCSQNTLAAALGITPPAVLPIVEELEAGGLVRRLRNADDRRSYDLTLTDEGDRRLRAARAAAGSVQRRVAERLGASADAELRRLLVRIVATA